MSYEHAAGKASGITPGARPAPTSSIAALAAANSELQAAIAVGRRMLAAYGDTAGFDIGRYAQAHGALAESLRILLRALTETTSTPAGLDLTGKRFGRLIAIERADKRHGKVTWRCLCDCGNETTVIGSQLKSGRTKSCGCGAPQTLDLVGQRFGRLTVVEFAGHSSGKRRARLWKCLCSCGTETTVRGRALVTGNTQSCGCLHLEAARTNSLVHGQTGTPLHSRWKGMIRRCTDSNEESYANYGGRGIKVCDQWLEPNGQGFLNFAADVGAGFSEGLELDRIDVDGDYEPGNVRWVTRAVNQRNKRNNHVLTFRGVQRTLTEWSEVTGLHRETIRSRVDTLGWTVERALTEGVEPEILARLDAEPDEVFPGSQKNPSDQRCPAAHPEDPTGCYGPVAVTVLDRHNAGADGCEHHGARLLASLDGGRVYNLPDAPDGAALRVFKAADSIRPFCWYEDAPRTRPETLSRAEIRERGEDR